MDNCLKCEFTDDYLNKACIQSESYYYLSLDKTCKSCHYGVDIGHGYAPFALIMKEI